MSFVVDQLRLTLKAFATIVALYQLFHLDNYLLCVFTFHMFKLSLSIVKFLVTNVTSYVFWILGKSLYFSISYAIMLILQNRFQILESNIVLHNFTNVAFCYRMFSLHLKEFAFLFVCFNPHGCILSVKERKYQHNSK